MIDKLDWQVIIRKEVYDVMLFADKFASISSHDHVKISRMYGLQRNGFNYVLCILTNGTYRLLSRGKKKIYCKGRLASIRWIPKLKESKTIH